MLAAAVLCGDVVSTLSVPPASASVPASSTSKRCPTSVVVTPSTLPITSRKYASPATKGSTEPAAGKVRVTFAPVTALTLPVNTAGRSSGTPRLIVEFSAAAYDITPTGALPVWPRSSPASSASSPSPPRTVAPVKGGKVNLVLNRCFMGGTQETRATLRIAALSAPGPSDWPN